MSYRYTAGGAAKSYESYTDVVVQHFMNPRNIRRINDVSGKGCTSSETLEDFVQLWVRVSSEQRIEATYCHVVGCSAAVACGSVFTEMVAGKPVAEAAAISAEDVLEALGGLPRSRVYCAGLPIVALQAALEDLKARRRLQSRRRKRPQSFIYRKPFQPSSSR